MKIVIPAWTLAHKHGGIRVLCEIASGLNGRGHHVKLVTFDDGEPAFPTRAEILRLAPVPRGPNLIGDVPKLRRMKDALDRERDADVLLANHHLTAWCVNRARNAARKFYYIQAYETDFYPRTPQRMAYRWLAERSYHYGLHHIANAPSVAALIPGQSEPVPIVPPGIDPAVFHARDRRPPGERLVIGTIGRREPWKGTADCFEAVRRVRARGIEVDFRVAFGNIPPGFDDVVRADDAPRDDRELADWYRSLDILVAAVYWGGAPYPPLEAMACGTAVVSTPNDHVREGVTALTAPQQDPAALAVALERMIMERDLRERLVTQGLSASAAHRWDSVVDKLEAILEGRIQAPRGR